MILKDKVAIITGGSRGIGQAVCESLSREGCNVFSMARSKADVLADVSNYSEVSRAVTQISKKTEGKIDILINAAGIHGAIGFIGEINLLQWEEAVKTNFFGTMYLIKAVLPFMGRSGRSKIINFSGGGATSPRPYFSAYAASKAAVVNLTENLSREFLEKGLAVDINVISPGAVNTGLLKEAINFGEKIDKAELTPEKAVALCLFLASADSDGLSGKLISAVHDNWKDIPKHIDKIMSSDAYTLRRIKPKDRGYDW